MTERPRAGVRVGRVRVDVELSDEEKAQLDAAEEVAGGLARVIRGVRTLRALFNPAPRVKADPGGRNPLTEEE